MRVHRLTWTEAAPINARIDSYDVYRSINGGEYARIVSLPITYDIFMAITAQTLTYDDEDIVDGGVYTYRVVANTDPEGPDVLTSNIVAADFTALTIQPHSGALAITLQAPVVTAPIGSTVIVPGSDSLAIVGKKPSATVFQPLFVAGKNDVSAASIMTSTDGMTWTLQTTPAAMGVNGLTWSPSLRLFVAVGGNLVFTSPDSVTWTQRVPAASVDWRDVAWAPSLALFVAVGNNGTNGVMTSPDGINWTLRTTTNRQWCSVNWSASLGLFAAGCVASPDNQAIMTSPDGITWTARTGSTAIPANGFPGYKMAVSPSGYFMATSRNDFGVLKSTNGTTWTFIATGLGGSAYTDAEIDPNGIVVLSRIGADHSFARSTNNGTSWAATANGDFSEDVTYSADLGRWVGVCNANAASGKKAIYSSDGNTWTDGTTPAGANTLPSWYRVIYVNLGA